VNRISYCVWCETKRSEAKTGLPRSGEGAGSPVALKFTLPEKPFKAPAGIPGGAGTVT
jgi:hypothetical protein